MLFFGGISGKFDWQHLNVVFLGMGAVVFLAGLGVVLAQPTQATF